jgi:Ala-tRNA(Pro) deacylase
VALEECRVDLKRLADALGAPRFSFGSAELLYQVLGVRPGSVTPFAAINDGETRVTVVLERAMLGHGPLNYHPLENDRTTAIAPPDLIRFLEACGHQPLIVDIPSRDD